MKQPAQFIVHTTKAGERWDLLAWRYYGDPTDYSPIIMANPMSRSNRCSMPGFRSRCRFCRSSSVVTAGLPPWKLSRAVSG